MNRDWIIVVATNGWIRMIDGRAATQLRGGVQKAKKAKSGSLAKTCLQDNFWADFESRFSALSMHEKEKPSYLYLVEGESYKFSFHQQRYVILESSHLMIHFQLNHRIAYEHLLEMGHLAYHHLRQVLVQNSFPTQPNPTELKNLFVTDNRLKGHSSNDACLSKTRFFSMT